MASTDDITEQIARASAEQRFGSKTPEYDDDGKFQVENDNDEDEVSAASAGQSTSKAEEPERRFVENRWICLQNDQFLEFIDDSWKPITSQPFEEIKLLWDQAAQPQQQVTVVDGVKMVWNPYLQQWIPDVEVNEDFLANYHMNYGAHTDYEKVPVPKPVKPKEEPEVKLTKQEKLARKRQLAEEAAQREKGWIKEDETKSTKVYVDGLPKTITEEEFIEFMSKCGIIMEDPRNKKPKIKLYKDAEGNLKGDGYCCYLNPASVELALTILDGYNYNGYKVSVEMAHFEMKGAFDPSKKKRKLTAEQKKRLEIQSRVLEWKPEKDRAFRHKSDCTVVMKSMFTMEEVCENPEIVLDIKDEITAMVTKFGKVRHITVHHSNPEGVITVTFDNVEAADLCVKSLDRIIRKGREISAKTWDGKTKYRCEETAEQKALRSKAWDGFLGVDEEEDHHEHSEDEHEHGGGHEHKEDGSHEKDGEKSGEEDNDHHE